MKYVGGCFFWIALFSGVGTVPALLLMVYSVLTSDENEDEEEEE